MYAVKRNPKRDFVLKEIVFRKRFSAERDYRVCAGVRFICKRFICRTATNLGIATSLEGFYFLSQFRISLTYN